MNAAATQSAMPPADALTADWMRASRRAVVAGIAAIGVAIAALAAWSKAPFVEPALLARAKELAAL